MMCKIVRSDNFNCKRDDSELLGTTVANNTGMNATTVTTSRDCEVPKLKTSRSDDYARWKRNVQCWATLTRVPKRNQAPLVILNAIIDAEAHEVATNMDHDQAESEDGLQILDEHFKPHTFMRKMSLWREFRKLEKTTEISWNDYVKKMKRLRSDLQHQNIEISFENENYRR